MIYAIQGAILPCVDDHTIIANKKNNMQQTVERLDIKKADNQWKINNQIEFYIIYGNYSTSIRNRLVSN